MVTLNIAYGSSSPTSSECNYSVIQCECLAIVYDLKQFWHYLCTWTMAIQEYDFEIVY